MISPAAGTTAAAQTDDADELLRQAVATMAGLSSYHFELTTPRGQTLFMENLELAALAGDVQRPDRFRATATAKAAIIELEMQVVGIGSRLWITDPTSADERYTEIPLDETTGPAGQTLVDLLNPDRVLLAAVGLVENPSVAGSAEIDGVETTRVDGTVSFADLAPAFGDFAPTGTPGPELVLSDPLPVSVWIDDTGRVRRLEIAGPLTAAEPPDVVRRLDLSAFNEPIDIQPPV